MIYRWLLAPILLLLPSLAMAQINVRGDLIDAPERVESGRTFLVKIKGDLPYSVRPEPPVLTELLDRQGNVVLFLTAGDESLTIQVRHQITHPTAEEIANTPIVTDPNDAEAVKRFKEYLTAHSTDEIFQDQRTVIVAKPDPGPGPTPDPDPAPDPDTPAPIPEPGFRVLIVYETGEATTLPTSQQAIIYGQQVRQYLNNTCIKESDGTAAYRIYDKDIDASGDLQVWRNAMQRRPTEIPWLIISNGKTGYEGPLPKTVEEFLSLCKKYEVK